MSGGKTVVANDSCCGGLQQESSLLILGSRCCSADGWWPRSVGADAKARLKERIMRQPNTFQVGAYTRRGAPGRGVHDREGARLLVHSLANENGNNDGS